MNYYCNITESPIDYAQLTGLYNSSKSGGVVIFLGTIRDNNQKMSIIYFMRHTLNWPIK